MNYVLIFWLIGSSAFAPTSTAVFADQAACQGALAAIEKNFQAPNTYDQTHLGVCVPQATPVAATPAPTVIAPDVTMFPGFPGFAQ